MIALIAAIDKKGVIGSDGKLPWHIPSDLKWFKEITSGHPVLMGRKTWDSFPRKPLPNRQNYVLTRSDRELQGAIAVRSEEDLLQLLAENKNNKLFVIGGASVYDALISEASDLYITHVEADVDGDTFFPTINPVEWVWNWNADYNVIPFERPTGDEYSYVIKHYTRIKGQNVDFSN